MLHCFFLVASGAEDVFFLLLEMSLTSSLVGPCTFDGSWGTFFAPMNGYRDGLLGVDGFSVDVKLHLPLRVYYFDIQKWQAMVHFRLRCEGLCGFC